MPKLDLSAKRRLLIVDDMISIHSDFKQILDSSKETQNQDLEQLEQDLFQLYEKKELSVNFELDFAQQGQEALEKVKIAVDAGRPYLLAFVDMRMPPGWDGLRTVTELWKIDPRLHVVICTAFSDYSWEQVVAELGLTSRLLILKKPFDLIEVKQVAIAMSEKRIFLELAATKMNDLALMAEERARQLISVNNQLTQVVRENEVIVDQLAEASRLAAIGTLAAGLAHEINTPLTTVLGYARIFEKDPQLPEKKRAEASRIVLAAEKMSAVIEKLKNFALQARNRDSELLKLEEVIAEALIPFQGRFSEISIETKIENDNGLPSLWGNRSDIETIFHNFYANSYDAFKRCVNERKYIHLNVTKLHDGLQVVYQDNAGGIAEDKIELVFNPFFTTKDPGMGTGLGLSVCYGIIKRHQGTIEVRSKLGIGTTFIMNFPLDRRKDRVDIEFDKINTLPEVNLNLDRPHVLVVDDENDVAEIFSMYIEKVFRTTVIKNSVEASELIEKNHYEIIVVDLKMPRMSGLDLLEVAQRAQPQTPVFIMSGHAEGDREVAALLAKGAAGIIAKPFEDSATLIKMLQNSLDQRPVK